ncbi:hypothetical protein BYT27DRAFT_6478284 [Phlegmacium glaucopus]|nr:hypothetical protein BYT27DRAFT_6478284 [Phlegmacium glaucopus]
MRRWQVLLGLTPQTWRPIACPPISHSNQSPSSFAAGLSRQTSAAVMTSSATSFPFNPVLHAIISLTANPTINSVVLESPASGPLISAWTGQPTLAPFNLQTIIGHFTIPSTNVAHHQFIYLQAAVTSSPSHAHTTPMVGSSTQPATDDEMDVDYPSMDVDERVDDGSVGHQRTGQRFISNSMESFEPLQCYDRRPIWQRLRPAPLHQSRRNSPV